MGYSIESERNQIANYALVEWDDNIDISDKQPSEYLPYYTGRFDDEELNKMYYWHCLPQGWETIDYREFLIQRRRLMAHVIKDAFEVLKQRQKVLTPLRANLDIENIEKYINKNNLI